MIKSINSLAGKLAAAAAMLLSCDIPVDLPPYVPQATFRGIVNSYELYLPGHTFKPNTVALFNDTLQMHFFSEDYDDNQRTWQGDQLKVEIYGHFSDSIIDNEHLLMKLSRFGAENETYLIGPPDTLDRLLKVQVNLVSMPVGNSSNIRIENIIGTMRRVGGGGVGIEIKDGVIEGSVE